MALHEDAALEGPLQGIGFYSDAYSRDQETPIAAPVPGAKDRGVT